MDESPNASVGELSERELSEALTEADIPILLLVLSQLTGDSRWLQAPFSPKRDISFFAEEGGGLPEELQAQVREAALRAVGGAPKFASSSHDAISDEKLTEMMSFCVGERVPPEYVGMMREEMGLIDRSARWSDRCPSDLESNFSVLIIGAGVSGICAGIQLKKLGIPFSILEKNTGLGGTWFENKYPGVKCDVPNHFYSYSFKPKLDWSAYFSEGAEIQQYLESCVDQFAIREHIIFGAHVEVATYQAQSSTWKLDVKDNEGVMTSLYANAVISATGQLNQPKVPDIPGMKQFTGSCFHTARWETGFDVKGKSVALIGTGASAMQVLPAIADQAAEVKIFQRSPQWAIPSRDYHRKVSERKKYLLKHVPFYASWYRFSLAWRFGDHLLAAVYRDPSWPHKDRSVSKKNDSHRKYLTDHILSELGSRKDLLPKVLPTYPPYGKRILVDNHWFKTLQKDNVELVTDPIGAIEETGLRLEGGGFHKADALIFATGFEATRLISPLNVVGRSGRTLRDVWGADDSRALLGITVPDFPNFFCLYGPNTNFGHGGSIFFAAECQVRYVTQCLIHLVENGYSEIDCQQASYDDYNRKLDVEHAKLIWTHPGMDTWYRNEAGRVVSIMPWRLVDYWRMTEKPDWDHYKFG